MFVASGIGPYCGQAVHFKFFAPEPKAYAVNRYTFEAERHWAIVNDQPASKPWMLGDTYTLVDMAVWMTRRRGRCFRRMPGCPRLRGSDGEGRARRVLITRN